MSSRGPISSFIKHHYRHFNAATLVEAAEGYAAHLQKGGKMFMTIAGAMSTAELGVSLAEMIRQDKVHGISCTGANLEEDVFNLVAHDFYERVPHWRDLSPQEEQALLDRHMNRVTDTCIPEEEAMRRIESVILREWVDADKKGERYFPHQFFYKILQSPDLQTYATFRHSYLSSLLGSHPLSMFSTNLASNFATWKPEPIPAFRYFP